MAGLNRGQSVPLHRCPHQLGDSTNPNKCFIYSCTLHCTCILAQPSFKTLAMAFIALQLTKSLSIISLHLIWTGYSQPGLKRPRLDCARVYYGLDQFMPRGILWLEEV